MAKHETFILKDGEGENFSSNPDIDNLRQSIYDHLIESGNISVLEAYFKNPKDIRMLIGAFNKSGNVLSCVTQEVDPKKSFMLEGKKSLAIKTADGQTKKLNFSEFVSLVKSNNNRLKSGESVKNFVKPISTITQNLRGIFKG